MIRETSRTKGLNEEEIDMQELDEIASDIRVKKNWIRGYACPEFILFDLEERIAKPWEKEVIINMLGRSIGFRAL